MSKNTNPFFNKVKPYLNLKTIIQDTYAIIVPRYILYLTCKKENYRGGLINDICRKNGKGEKR